jgi:2-oxoglutarate ferredoxin oxidoreductase subunit beta
VTKNLPVLKHKDFASDQDVRWCPGCGDYVVLSAVHKAMAALGRPPHECVLISGIGCSSRFPYYMSTYGFHTIHGRAPTIASGVKSANPELSVWIVTGDGDGLSIGGNHLLHVLRRNLDVNVLLFNNRVYGLTKGQYSPCSEQGMVTKTSPLGAIEQPVNPLSFALASQSTFIARTYDSDPKHMTATLTRAAQHKGVSFVEIYQNCRIFNDGVFEKVTDRKVRSDTIVFLEEGAPMIFGKLGNKGLRLNGLDPEVVEFDPDSPPDDLLVHDEDGSIGLSYLLTRLDYPEFPVPMGVFRQVEMPTYEDQLHGQIAAAKEKVDTLDLQTLFRRGAETWVIEESADLTVTGRVEHIGGELGGAGSTEKDSYIADLAGDSVEYEGVDRALREAFLSQVTAQSETIVAPPTMSVAKALDRMRAQRALGTILVEDADHAIAGIVTERDLLARVSRYADLEAVTLGEIMTPNPEMLVPTDSIGRALNFMGARNYRRVPIVSESGVTVLTIDDMLDFIREV